MDSFPAMDTDRLYLVKIGQKYAEDLFHILSNEQVIKYYGKESLININEAKQLIDHIHLYYRQKRSIRWGIIYKENGNFIGSIGLNNLNLWNKKAEIGYELHPEYWRRGIMFEAANAVLQYGFSQLDLFRIGAVTYPENVASNRLLQKLGFRQEGLLRGYLYQNGLSHDAIMHSILRPEWNYPKNVYQLISNHKREKQPTLIPSNKTLFRWLNHAKGKLKLDFSYRKNEKNGGIG